MANKTNKTKGIIGSHHDFGLADWLVLIAGVWLIVSPFALSYNDIPAALAAELTLGVVLVSLSAFVAIRHAIGSVLPEYQRTGGDLSVGTMLIPAGAITVLSPFIFQYSPLIGNLVINEIVIGSFVIMISVIVTVNHALIATEMAREEEGKTEKLHRAA